MKVITYELIYTPLAKTNHSDCPASICFFVLIRVPTVNIGLLHGIIQETQKDYIWVVYCFDLCLSPYKNLCKLIAPHCQVYHVTDDYSSFK